MTEIKIIDAAKILGRHEATVARMCRDGELKAKKRGKTWYLNEDYVRRVAATLLPSVEASKANLAHGRPQKAEPGQPVIRRKPVKLSHKNELNKAIQKREPEQEALLARIRAMGEAS